MKIQKVETIVVTVPLVKPFKTALRTVSTAQSVYVKLTTEEGLEGWGEAPPTHVITGDSITSIRSAVEELFAPALIGQSLLHREALFDRLQQTLIGNRSAQAAIDCAIYDLLGQIAQLPLYQLLGGARATLETDFTISMNPPDEMAEDVSRAVAQGFRILKVKLGSGCMEEDWRRLQAVAERMEHGTIIRIDANQAWQPKEAVRFIRALEDREYSIEFIEQPVRALNIDGLKYVTDHTLLPIMADESVFTLHDACTVLQQRAVDVINIKLMKAGGIHEALKINTLAEAYGIECMVGCMVETKLGVTAAAHFAASQRNVTYYDLDAPLLLANDSVGGGIRYDGSSIHFQDASGLGLDQEQMNSLQKEVMQ